MNNAALDQADLQPLTISGRQDFFAGLRRWDVFTRLGWFEVKRRYRRTIIGPLWGTLNLSVFILALGTVGGGLLNKNFSEYLPFLAAGMIMWIFLSTIISESCSLFVSSQNLFKQMQFSYSSLAYALVWRNFIVFLHNLAAYFLFFVLTVPHLITPWTLLAIPGIAIVIVNGVWVALLFGMICLRFRDLQQLVTTFLQIGMFITPVFWTPDSLTGIRRFIFVELNPLYSMIEVVRAPLMGTPPAQLAYITAGLITIIGWTITLLFFGYFRKRIAYWA
jgi:ABC-type polysaccharide/polyol phosphate export permease